MGYPVRFDRAVGARVRASIHYKSFMEWPQRPLSAAEARARALTPSESTPVRESQW